VLGVQDQVCSAASASFWASSPSGVDPEGDCYVEYNW